MSAFTEEYKIEFGVCKIIVPSNNEIFDPYDYKKVIDVGSKFTTNYDIFSQ